MQQIFIKYLLYAKQCVRLKIIDSLKDHEKLSVQRCETQAKQPKVAFRGHLSGVRATTGWCEGFLRTSQNQESGVSGSERALPRNGLGAGPSASSCTGSSKAHHRRPWYTGVFIDPIQLFLRS